MLSLKNEEKSVKTIPAVSKLLLSVTWILQLVTFWTMLLF